jgi:hypothetical protein
MKTVEAAHTPGPWTMRPSFALHWDYAIETAAADIAHVLRLARSDEPALIAVATANARLIAAAPELLAALKAILVGFESGVLCRNTDSDGLSDWAIRAAPALAALAAGQRAIANAEEGA